MNYNKTKRVESTNSVLKKLTVFLREVDALSALRVHERELPKYHQQHQQQQQHEGKVDQVEEIYQNQ